MNTEQRILITFNGFYIIILSLKTYFFSHYKKVSVCSFILEILFLKKTLIKTNKIRRKS